MKPITRIYIAGPLGFSEFGRTAQSAVCTLLEANGYKAIDPFALAPKDEIDRLAKLPLDLQKERWSQLNMSIGAINQAAIDSCDAIVAILDGPDVDSGTAAEIGYAYAKGKPIVGYRGDFRLAADNVGGIVNLQVEYFIRASGGTLVTASSAIPPALLELSRRA